MKPNQRNSLGLSAALLVAGVGAFLYFTAGKNRPPVANGDAVSILEDTTLTFDPRRNDLDADSDSLFIANVTTANGTVSVLGGTNIVYLPPTNFNGKITLDYTINDGKGSTASAVITGTVTPLNDAPFADDQSVSTLEDTALLITLTGSDIEGEPLTYVQVSGPANGALSDIDTKTGALTYTPNPNYNGSDSFTFRADDGTTNSATATVSITVTPVNDLPIAKDQSVTTPEDTALPITLTGSDVEGSPLTLILASGPANGVVSGFNTNTGALSYQPNTNYAGSDLFTFRTSDGTNRSVLATVSITVTPVNDTPVITNQSVTKPEATALPIPVTSSNVEGSPQTFIAESGPTNSSALTYLPNTNYPGSDPFAFRTNNAATNRFQLSGRIGFNISGKFSRLGNGLFTGGTPIPRFTPDGDPYNYDDGYLLTDVSGNLGGQTWYVGYDESATQISGNQLLLSRSTASANTAGTDQNADVSVGFAATYQRQLGFKDRFNWGFEASANYQPIKFSDNNSYDATVTKVTDAYAFTPGTTPPNATPGSPYQGTYNGPGFLFGDTVVGSSSQTIPGGAAFSGRHEFDGNLWGFQLGLYGAYQLSERWQVSTSGGFALGILSADVTWSELGTQPGGGSASASGGGNDSDVLYGFYLGASVGYDLGKNWSVIGGVQYQFLNSYENDFSGRTVEVDFSGSLFVTVGISKTF